MRFLKTWLKTPLKILIEQKLIEKECLQDKHQFLSGFFKLKVSSTLIVKSHKYVYFNLNSSAVYNSSAKIRKVSLRFVIYVAGGSTSLEI